MFTQRIVVGIGVLVSCGKSDAEKQAEANQAEEFRVAHGYMEAKRTADLATGNLDVGQAALADFKAWISKVYTQESRKFEGPSQRTPGARATFTTNCKMSIDVRATNQVAKPFEGVVETNGSEAVFQRDGTGWTCDPARSPNNACDSLANFCKRDRRGIPFPVFEPASDRVAP